MTNYVADRFPSFGYVGFTPGDNSNQVTGEVGTEVYYAVVVPLVRPLPGQMDDYVFRGAERLRWWLYEEISR